MLFSSRMGTLPMEPKGWAYMLASARNGTLYVGSAVDLSFRIYEHKEKLRPGFTSTHGVTMLVWYEHYPSLIEARHREYAIKKWRRAWKIALIERMNPDWRDLYDELNS
jgi:putative endonuclease